MPRVLVDYRSDSKESYKKFKKGFKHLNLSYDDYCQIIFLFNNGMLEYAFETGENIKLPNGLGEVGIYKKKQVKTKLIDGELVNFLSIDWKKTMEKGKRIYNLNHHSDGYKFGFAWAKHTAFFKYSTLFYFKPTRVTSRTLAHYVKVDKKYQNLYKEQFHQLKSYKNPQ